MMGRLKLCLRIAADKKAPVAIEIHAKAAAGHDLHQIEQPRREILTGCWVAGFRDLWTTARRADGVDVHPPPLPNTTHLVDLG